MKLTPEQFASLVEEAVASLPAQFAPYMRDVVVDVQDEPDAATCRRVGVSDKTTLLGLYHGVPLTRRSVEHLVKWPDRIVIYRKNIERICRTRAQIVRQIRKTVLHEVGHHFGLSERQLRELQGP